MNVIANNKVLIVLVLLVVVALVVALPHPRVLPDGKPGKFSLIQMYAMQFADGRIENLYQSEKEELALPVQAVQGECRSATKMKAVGARLEADSQQITGWEHMGYPGKAQRYDAYAAVMAAKAKAFQQQSENCSD